MAISLSLPLSLGAVRFPGNILAVVSQPFASFWSNQFQLFPLMALREQPRVQESPCPKPGMHSPLLSSRWTGFTPSYPPILSGISKLFGKFGLYLLILS